MATIGTLAVNLVMNMNPFSKGVDSARRKLGGIQRDVVGFGAALSRFAGIAAGVGGIYGLGRMALGTVNAIDELDELSSRVGVSVGGLQKLQYAAKLSGVESTQLTTAVERLNKSIGIAAKSAGTEREMFRDLGLELDELTKISPEQAFAKFADALQKQEGTYEKTRLLIGLLGRSGGQLSAMLAGGGEKMREMFDEFERLHGTPTDKDVAQIVEFADQLDRLRAMLGGFKQKLVIDVTPMAVAFMDNFLRGAEFLKTQLPKINAKNWWENFSRGANFLLTGRNQPVSKQEAFQAAMGKVHDEIQRTRDLWELAKPPWLRKAMANARGAMQWAGQAGLPIWLNKEVKDPLTPGRIGEMLRPANRAMGRWTGLDQDSHIANGLRGLIDIIRRQIELDRRAADESRKQRVVVLEPAGLN